MRREDLYDAVVAYQIDRLKQEYADFAHDPKHRVVGDFFFDRVYATRDKAERDAGARRLFETARKILGSEITDNFGKLIHLNALTDRLDGALVDRMAFMGLERFAEPDYEEAYRLCDNYAQRVEQIELTVGALHYFHSLAQVPGIGMALALLRPVAALKGASVIYEFLRDGYRGFRTVATITPFATAVREREIQRLDRIYGRTDGSPARTRRPTRRNSR